MIVVLKYSKLLVIGLMAASLLLTGCSPSGYAAKVGGDVLSEDAFERTLEEVWGESDFGKRLYELASAQSQGGLAVAPPERSVSEANTIPIEISAALLTFDVQAMLAKQGITDAKIELTEVDRAAGRQLATGFFGEAEFELLPGWYQEKQIELNASNLALGRRLYDQNPERFQTLCIRNIQSATEEGAAKARAELENGGDFAQIARREAGAPEDSAFDGALGCAQRSELVQLGEPAASVLSELEQGALTEPVQTEFGYHIFQVTEITSPTFEELQSSESQAAKPSDVWLDEAAGETEIKINPRFGRLITDEESEGQSLAVTGLIQKRSAPSLPSQAPSEQRSNSDPGGSVPGGVPGEVPGGVPPQGSTEGVPQEAPQTQAPPAAPAP
jgi:hypothetical protein